MAEDLNGASAESANAGGTPPAAKPDETTQGTSAAATTGSEEKKELVAKEAYDALQAELNKERQHKNQLENKIKDDERVRLEKQGEWEELAKKTQAELDKIKQEKEDEKEQLEAEKFRDGRIALRPQRVQDAARKLIDRNPASFFWRNVNNWDEAQKEVDAQLDALQEALGETSEEKPEINPNNPNPSNPGTPPATKESWKALEEKLANQKL